jgi:hypothetical protein
MHTVKLTSDRTLHSALKPIIHTVEARSKKEIDSEHRDRKEWMRVSKDERELIELYRAAK